MANKHFKRTISCADWSYYVSRRNSALLVRVAKKVRTVYFEQWNSPYSEQKARGIEYSNDGGDNWTVYDDACTYVEGALNRIGDEG